MFFFQVAKRLVRALRDGHWALRAHWKKIVSRARLTFPEEVQTKNEQV
jgi:hypothetical protein